MKRRLVGNEDDESVALAIGNVAAMLESIGRPADALPLNEEALAMYRRLHADDHPDVARSLGTLADTLTSLGRHSDALPLREEALAMRRRIHAGDHPDIATALGSLAVVLHDLDRASEALSFSTDALAMYRRLHPGDHPDVASGVHNVASILGTLGRRAEELPLLEDALETRRRLYPDDHPEIASTLNAIALALDALGRRDDAIRTAAEAYAMSVRLGAFTRCPYGSHLGAFLLRAGRPRDALEPLSTAISVLEAQRSDARSLRSEERTLYVESLRGAVDPYALSIQAHVVLKDPAAAFDLLERGRGREMLDVLARSSVDLVERAAARAEAANDMKALSRIRTARADRAEAEAHFVGRRSARERSDGSRDERIALRAAEDGARSRLIATMSELQRLVRDLLPEADPLSLGQIRALLSHDERILAYSLSEVACLAFVVGPASIDVLPLEERGNRLSLAVVSDAIEQYRYELAHASGDASDRLNKGRRLFRMLVPEGLRSTLLGCSRVYLMPHGGLEAVPFETLVVGEAEGQPVHWIDVGPTIAYEPSASVLGWLRALSRDTDLRVDLVAVADPVFAGQGPPVEWPASGVLVTGVRPDGQAERVGLRAGDVVVRYDGRDVADPDALRAGIAAAGEDRGDVVVQFVREDETRRVAVTSGPLGVEIASEPPQVSGPRLLARRELPSVLRTAERGRRMTPLPGTRREVEGIVDAFRARRGSEARMVVLLGRDAGEAGLFTATQSPRYLHVATHGVIDEYDAASFSGLALTMPRVPVPGDDGFLTLVDLLQRWQGKLRGTELVVLSACESTRGRRQRDDGMYALPWGFLFAGARSVVGSLWKVDDEKTAFLMREFYAQLLDGIGPLDALTAARRTAKAKYPHPCHWGAFVFTGAAD
jgi:tetratricopeptide (TPR) repeat protein